jgi:hypothetical protein
VLVQLGFGSAAARDWVFKLYQCSVQDSIGDSDKNGDSVNEKIKALVQRVFILIAARRGLQLNSTIIGPSIRCDSPAAAGRLLRPGGPGGPGGPTGRSESASILTWSDCNICFFAMKSHCD